MNIISQVIKHRRSTVKYPLKHGVTKAAIQYNTYRPFQSTYSCGIKAHSGYEASKSRSWSAGFLVKAR